MTSRLLPRQEWISFIPGAHPGYITLDQYDANRDRLTANAAAHGRDRVTGPPREGTALLQGIIICGRCGGRMTVRYHQRGGQDLPTYVCQRDGIANGHRICTTIPGHSLDQRIGMLLIETLTPLAIEAALTVQAELQHRADEADALRAAHVERARYHADLARRRYLAVDPANRLVAGTLEADWNTSLRAHNEAQEAYDNARQQHLRQLTETQKARIGLVGPGFIAYSNGGRECGAGEREMGLAAVQGAASMRGEYSTLRTLGRVRPGACGSFTYVSPFAKPSFRGGGDDSVL